MKAEAIKIDRPAHRDLRRLIKLTLPLRARNDNPPPIPIDPS